MSVYFVQPVAERDKVKIGTTVDIDQRLQAISSDFPDGVELIGLADGDATTERAFHRILAAYWLEGEWYAFTPEVAAVLAPFADGVSGKRVWGRFRVIAESGGAPIEEDKRIAFEMLKLLMDKSGAVPIAVAQQNAFNELTAINPMWSRRRVRAIWERTIRRVDHYEIRDMQTAMDAYREMASRMGRADCP
ncbi:MAG: GIY-YIG nuclease family protein [Sterolibacterium sp.]